MSHYTLDARNLLCPMPVIRLQQAIAEHQAADTIDVLCTDPGAKHDIPAWCKIHGHRVKSIDDEEHTIVITVEKGSE